MKRNLRKSYLLVVVLLMITMYLGGCEKKQASEAEISNEYAYNIEIDEENARAINIEDKKIIDIKKAEQESISTKIENISSFDISNIWLTYDELDENRNVISTQDVFLDLTLSYSEVSSIVFSYKEHTDAIDVVAYGYESGDKVVSVNLKDDSIKISENKSIIEDSKKYDILTISEIQRESESKDTNTYTVRVKNSSTKDLSNISLKIGELRNNEYIAINHLPTNNVLKGSEEIDLDIITTTEADKLSVLGYTYDDISEKVNISIDLKSERAKINK